MIHLCTSHPINFCACIFPLANIFFYCLRCAEECLNVWKLFVIVYNFSRVCLRSTLFDQLLHSISEKEILPLHALKFQRIYACVCLLRLYTGYVVMWFLFTDFSTGTLKFSGEDFSKSHREFLQI